MGKKKIIKRGIDRKKIDLWIKNRLNLMIIGGINSAIKDHKGCINKRLKSSIAKRIRGQIEGNLRQEFNIESYFDNEEQILVKG